MEFMFEILRFACLKNDVQKRYNKITSFLFFFKLQPQLIVDQARNPNGSPPDHSQTKPDETAVPANIQITVDSIPEDPEYGDHQKVEDKITMGESEKSSMTTEALTLTPEENNSITNQFTFTPSTKQDPFSANLLSIKP